MRLKYAVISLFLTLALVVTPAMAKKKHKKQPDALHTLASLPKASMIMEENGKILISKRADVPRVPASTMKLLTSLAAIERWGLKHRFHTDFYVDKQKRLWIKGYGDPFMVSEEVDLVVSALKGKGLKQISGIVLDGSYYAPNLVIDGRSQTDNPYDAPITALAVNFNTAAIKKTKKSGVVISDKRTPLTAVTIALTNEKIRKHGAWRVNLGTEKRSERYYGELFSAKLKQQGVKVGGKISTSKVNRHWKPYYVHENSRDLEKVLKSMLYSSSNFIANQLFLQLAESEANGRPITMAMASRSMMNWSKNRFHWNNYSILEGSGLSRGTKLSARQMMQVVKAFTPYRFLLRTFKKGKVMAKTGTLKGVSCYAGFVNRNGKWQPFSVLINQSVGGYLRKNAAIQMTSRKKLPAICDDPSC
jgi:D-alanyl-D-alanine carboxypeptidase/D-alanyl-D-alanine-endopeptidase (penicillin-binding protein 4)